MPHQFLERVNVHAVPQAFECESSSEIVETGWLDAGNISPALHNLSEPSIA